MEWNVRNCIGIRKVEKIVEKNKMEWEECAPQTRDYLDSFSKQSIKIILYYYYFFPSPHYATIFIVEKGYFIFTFYTSPFQ